MTDAPDVPPVEELLRWLIREAGSVKKLAEKSKVSVDTLNGWRDGGFPRVRRGAAVSAVDDWARLEFGARYPPSGFHPDGLLYYCREQPAGSNSKVDESFDSDTGEAAAAGSSAAEPQRWWRRRPVQVGVGAIVVVLAAGLAILVANRQGPVIPSATIVVANKVAFRTDKYAEDTTPAYLSSRPVKECKKHGCALPGTDMSSGYSLTVTCHMQGDQMTNYDTTSGTYGVNPNAFYSNEWYRATWQDGRTGYISYVYIAAANRGGMGLPVC